MVIGLDIFKQYFEQYPENYIIIGGTACDIIIDEAGFTPRVTKDIDIILIVEALNANFVKQFWQFIKDGNYKQQEESTGERKYYRFMKPENKNFPYQIELFARTPDLITLNESAHLTPIPVDDDLSSLSAILLNDDYYRYLIIQSVFENGLHRANTEALICLKAKAYLDIAERIANKEKVDEKHLRKHKADIFRLAVTLTANQEFETPLSVHNDLQTFAKAIANELPDKNMFKEMGLGSINPQNVFKQLLQSFNMTV